MFKWKGLWYLREPGFGFSVVGAVALRWDLTIYYVDVHVTSFQNCIFSSIAAFDIPMLLVFPPKGNNYFFYHDVNGNHRVPYYHIFNQYFYLFPGKIDAFR